MTDIRSYSDVDGSRQIWRDGGGEVPGLVVGGGGPGVPAGLFGRPGRGWRLLSRGNVKSKEPSCKRVALFCSISDMGKNLNPFYSTPVAILVGSLIITVAILMHGGIIKIGKAVKTAPAAQAPSQAPPAGGQAKTEADIIKNLKDTAGKLGLDKGKFDKCLDSGEKASLVKKDLDEGTTAGVNGTPAFFVNGRLLSGAQPFAEFKKVIDEELSGSATTANRVTVAVGDLPILGQSNAKVTLIEFSDYQCPFCGRHFTQTEPQLIKEYIDKGLVKFYYRDFPLSQIHPGAQKAAEAARCAGDQNKYWEYHDLIFQNQQNIF